MMFCNYIVVFLLQSHIPMVKMSVISSFNQPLSNILNLSSHVLYMFLFLKCVLIFVI
jgi:hypothetical protein